MTHDTWVTFKTLVAKEFLLIRRNKWLTAGAWVRHGCRGRYIGLSGFCDGQGGFGGALDVRDAATSGARRE